LIVLYESDDRLFDSRMNASRRFMARDAHFKFHAGALEAIRLIAEGLLVKNKNALTKLLFVLKREQKKSSKVFLNKHFDFVEWIDKKQSEIPSE
ncbi:MAG TPA: hypothetical protein VNX68_14120, partial [Nitrosopumilaceae archaeon]|nr:hypothetical protein [Nitrosopumilaceae archaeon]